MIVRKLKPEDFEDVWDLCQGYIDDRLRTNRAKARGVYLRIISDNRDLTEGGFNEDGDLIGVVIVSSERYAYAEKAYGNVFAWIGPLALLERAIDWWEGRPVMRCFMLTFPTPYRPGMIRWMRSKGFERSGDMNVIWR